MSYTWVKSGSTHLELYLHDTNTHAGYITKYDTRKNTYHVVCMHCDKVHYVDTVGDVIGVEKAKAMLIEHITIETLK